VCRVVLNLGGDIDTNRGMAAGICQPSLFIILTGITMAAKRTAYSLAEMIVVVLILGALSFIAIPHLNFAALQHKQVNTIAKKIVTDLRKTRTLAIANAANNTTGFTLSISGLSYQIIDDSNNATVDSQTIDSHIICGGGTVFSFGPLGNLRSGAAPITLSSEGKTYTITVISATGIVVSTGG
jgi:Tfp pilus assembly protein FimT